MAQLAWKEAFQTRVKEIDIYLRFLGHVVERSAELRVGDRKRPRNRAIEDDVQRVLKAGFFLMLYNFVEATVREGLLEISEALKVENVSYRAACDQIRTIWIGEQFGDLERSHAPLPAFRTKAQQIAASVLEDAVIALSKDKLPISGNIDARKVRQIATLYGFSHKCGKRARGGENLELVKERRNALAHGYITFSECGRDYTVSQLRDIKTETVSYLRDIRKNIATYLGKSLFKAA